jgi:hypothetical protein
LLLLLLLQDAARRLGGGQQLDVLVVNSYCSTAQVGGTRAMQHMQLAWATLCMLGAVI